MRGMIMQEVAQYAKTCEPAIHHDPGREQLILDHLPQIKYIAHRISTKLPSHVELNDLVSAGVIGLLDAVEKFDPGRGVKFKTYAELRIKGLSVWITPKLAHGTGVHRLITYIASPEPAAPIKAQRKQHKCQCDYQSQRKTSHNQLLGFTPWFMLLRE